MEIWRNVVDTAKLASFLTTWRPYGCYRKLPEKSITSGSLNLHDMGLLIGLDTTMTGDRYVNILSDHLHPFMSTVHSDGHREFQQRKATTHISRIATEWPQEPSSKFRPCRWSAKSSDMNIIRHI
ncbi:DDE_3 domain-containing protein [Trichonephila clavipes]|nr:DDE_3 domain-containing protein [Trichonephila clavipes]